LEVYCLKDERDVRGLSDAIAWHGTSSSREKMRNCVLDKRGETRDVYVLGGEYIGQRNARGRRLNIKGRIFLERGGIRNKKP